MADTGQNQQQQQQQNQAGPSTSTALSTIPSGLGNDAASRELYFLALRLLEASPCADQVSGLARRFEELDLLPQRHHPFTGAPLPNTTLAQVKAENPHITADFLLRALEQLRTSISVLSPPPVGGIESFLSSGRFSLLRPADDQKIKLTLTRKPNRAPTLISFMSNHRNHAPVVPSVRFTGTYPANLTTALISRELAGPKPLPALWPTRCYEKYQKYKRILGHLSSVYCVLFDRTGRYIFTGADDRLVKIWSAVDGRLMMTLRGHEEEITDLSVDYENSMVATGSCDKIIRVWCLKTTAPVAILREHTATVTSVRFCPLMKDPEKRYLVSTSNDGTVCFWEYNPRTRVFKEHPTRFVERKRPGAHILCLSFSAGGVLLAVGSSDAYLRVYHVAAPAGPTKILEIEEHSDHVDSMQFSNHSTRFASGSRDGIARIWYYEKQSWRNIELRMSERLPGQAANGEPEARKLRVSMVGWSCDDAFVITSLNDNSIKVWDSRSGRLRHVLYAHEQEVFVLEAHPSDPRLLLSGGHDGALILWDLVTGMPIRTFFNSINGQGHGAIFDAKFSPDGTMFASTDSHGHLALYGLAHSTAYEQLPDQIFFHTDYRPLSRDANAYVIDEQTQIAPHLMPPAFLVDIDGNPYPPAIQRLVPGRENCADNQLIPYVAPNPDNDAQPIVQPGQWQPPMRPEPEEEAMEAQDAAVVAAPAPGDVDPANHQLIDQRIESMQRHRDGERAADQAAQQQQAPAPPAAPGENLGGARDRRNGDIEGVLQLPAFYARGNTLRPNWHRKPVVPMLSEIEIEALIQQQQVLATAEEEYYAAERKKRPEVPDLAKLKEIAERERLTRSKRRILQQRRGVRLPPPRPGELENIEEMHISEDDEENDRDFSADSSSSSVSSDSESDEDWNGPGTGGYTLGGGGGQMGSALVNGRLGGSQAARAAAPTTEERHRANRVERMRAREARRAGRARSPTPSDGQTDEEEQDAGQAEVTVSLGTTSRSTRRQRERATERRAARSEQAEDREERRRRRDPERQARRQEQLAEIRNIHRRRLAANFNSITELPEAFRPPEWLTDNRPKRTPYFPQIGDEVVYFRSGHQHYIDVVRGRGLYQINGSVKPYKVKGCEADEIFARVEDVKFTIKAGKGVRVATLKMVVLDPEAEEPVTGTHFSIKYHDVENVVDFIVLKKYYDQSIALQWKPGDEFRAVIDDKWWFGLINSQRETEPFTWFQCFAVTWANGDSEHLSPWDFEPIPEGYDRGNGEEGLEVTEEERVAIIDNDFVDTDGRLLSGLIRIMEYSQSEDFNVPVDLNQHPIYGMIIAYLMDLSTIKARIESGFYRRTEAIIFDVNAIEANALQYNEEGSEIVKRARIVTTVLRRFINDPDCFDPTPIYTEITANLEEFLQQFETNTRGGSSRHQPTPESDRPRRSTRRPRPLLLSDSDEGGGHSGLTSSQRRSQRTVRAPAHYLDESSLEGFEPAPPVSAIRPWKQNCRELLDYIFDLQDSEPFRTAVDPIQYPTYSHVIDTPMDLTTVKEQLLSDNYENPIEFQKDMRLIFANSKQFNTNKKSRIYSMTIRLGALFEEKMRKIINDYKSAANFLKRSGGSSARQRRPLNSFGTAMAELGAGTSGRGRANGYGPSGAAASTSARASRAPTSHQASSLRSPLRSKVATASTSTTTSSSASSTASSSAGTRTANGSSAKRTLFSEGEGNGSDSKSYELRRRKKPRLSYDSEASDDDEEPSGRGRRTKRVKAQSEDEEESEEERTLPKVVKTASGRVVKRPAVLDSEESEEEEEEEESDDETKAEEEEEEADDEEDEGAGRGGDSDATQIEGDEEEGDDTDKENEQSGGRRRRSARDHRGVERYGATRGNSTHGDDRRRPTRAAAAKRVNYLEFDDDEEGLVDGSRRRVIREKNNNRSSRRSSFAVLNEESRSSMESTGTAATAEDDDGQALRRSRRNVRPTRRYDESDDEEGPLSHHGKGRRQRNTERHSASSDHDHTDLYSAVKARRRGAASAGRATAGSGASGHEEEDSDDDDSAYSPAGSGGGGHYSTRRSSTVPNGSRQSVLTR